MAIEIKELVIRATVQSDEKGGQSQNKKQGDDEKDEIISECVEQVLRVLQRNRDR